MKSSTIAPSNEFQSPMKDEQNDQPILLPIIEDGALSEEEFYQSRIQAISEMISGKNLTLESEVSQLDILNILDNIGNNQFDRDIAEQLFEKIPQEGVKYEGETMYFELKDFIDTYIKAEYLLILQIKETHQEILKVNDELKISQESLDNALKNEVLNQYSLSINSSLNINVIEAISDSKGFVVNPNCSYTATAICNKYKYESDPISASSSMTSNINSDYNGDTSLFNPKFDYDFHIKIETGDEKVILCLRETDNKAKGNPILKTLKTTFGVQSYLDQVEHESWLKLYDEKNNYAKVQLHCIIQFRFSDAKYYQDSLKSSTEIRDKLFENKSILESSLLNLVAPFIPQPQEFEENFSQQLSITRSNSNTNAGVYY